MLPIVTFLIYWWVVFVEPAVQKVIAPVTVIVIELLVAVVGLAHVALEVIKHETTLPLTREVVVYVAELVPTFVVPIFHW